jgi:hypothetical protein
LSDKKNTGVYLSILQYERVQTMAHADGRSVSSFIGRLIDQAWDRYLAEKETSPTEKEIA